MPAREGAGDGVLPVVCAHSLTLSHTPVTPSGRYVNPAFMAVTGYTFEESTNRNCAFLQGPKTEPEVVQRIRDALRTSSEIRVTLTNYKKDGTAFQNLLALVPVFSEDSAKARYFLGIQFEVGADFDSSKLLQLDSIVGLLPRKIYRSLVSA